MSGEPISLTLLRDGVHDSLLTSGSDGLAASRHDGVLASRHDGILASRHDVSPSRHEGVSTASSMPGHEPSLPSGLASGHEVMASTGLEVRGDLSVISAVSAIVSPGRDELDSSPESSGQATPFVRAEGTTTTVSDLIALTKPRITVVVLSTALAGYFFAGPSRAAASPGPGALPSLLLGTWLIVGGANALNMWVERDSDRFMSRTRNRPLPAGRMSPKVALIFGVLLSLISLPILALGANPTTAALALIANLSYVLMYTPLKRVSWTAVLVGAVPGAIPPLLGWAAATGRVSDVGISLFALMFAWQVPHFHAIALFRREEYERAGVVVLPNAWGVAPTLLQISAWTVLLVSTSLLPFFLGATSVIYLIVALALGSAFVALSFAGFTSRSVDKWARSFFGFSIPYLIALFAVLIATRTSGR